MMLKRLLTICCFIAFVVCQFCMTSAYSLSRLLVFPNDGVSSIITEINQAKYSIDIVMYGFTDRDIYRALVAAKKRGVTVSILIQHYPYLARDENIPMINKFMRDGIRYQWSNPKFNVTHQKTIVIDDRKAIIMTGNFTFSNFSQRNFALITDNHADVKQILDVFQADWNRHHIKLFPTNLLWSPNDSEIKLQNFIIQAKESLLVYNQEIGQTQLLHTLAFSARKGTKVQIIIPAVSVKKYCIALKYLYSHDIAIALDNNLYIHAKGMLVDGLSKNPQTFIGSINFSYPGLHDNRELGIIVRSPQVSARFYKVFQYDWSKSTLFKGKC